jgi:hypothetical protein
MKTETTTSKPDSFLVETAIGHTIGNFQDWTTAKKTAIENRHNVFKVIIWRITADRQAVIGQIAPDTMGKAFDWIAGDYRYR